MKKLVIFYSFVITSFMVISGILGVKNLPELLTAILFSPIAFYFAVLMIPRKSKAIITVEPVLDIIPDKIRAIKNPNYDPERRKFLKLISAAGGSLFMMTLFTKKAEAAFFGSMPGPGTVAVKNTLGVQIDPAEKKPTDGYRITDIDDSGADVYYGFVNKDGGWFIQKETSTGAYRYFKGDSSYADSWAVKTTLGYSTFDLIF